LETRQVIRQIDVGIEPEGVAISPGKRIAVTTSETTNMAHLIDTATFEVTDNILVDQRPRHAEFTSDGAKLWVSAEIGGTVSIIDMAERRIEDKLSFEIPGLTEDVIQPVGIKLTKDDKTAFVALGPANRVAVIDVATKRVTKYILVGQRVWHLAFSADEKMLFTTNGVSNDVTAIDTTTLRAVKSITVGRYPWGLALKGSKRTD